MGQSHLPESTGRVLLQETEQQNEYPQFHRCKYCIESSRLKGAVVKAVPNCRHCQERGSDPVAGEQLQKALHAILCPVDDANACHIVRTMAGVLPKKCSLKHLGLHHLHLQPHFRPFPW